MRSPWRSTCPLPFGARDPERYVERQVCGCQATRRRHFVLESGGQCGDDGLENRRGNVGIDQSAEALDGRTPDLRGVVYQSVRQRRRDSLSVRTVGGAGPR